MKTGLLNLFVYLLCLLCLLSCGQPPVGTYTITSLSYSYHSYDDLYIWINYTLTADAQAEIMDRYVVAFDVYDTGGYVYTSTETELEVDQLDNSCRTARLRLLPSRDINGVAWEGIYTVRTINPRYIELSPSPAGFKLRDYRLPFVQQENGSWLAVSE